MSSHISISSFLDLPTLGSDRRGGGGAPFGDEAVEELTVMFTFLAEDVWTELTSADFFAGESDGGELAWPSVEAADAPSLARRF